MVAVVMVAGTAFPAGLPSAAAVEPEEGAEAPTGSFTADASASATVEVAGDDEANEPTTYDASALESQHMPTLDEFLENGGGVA